MADAISWTPIEDALVRWVIESSGLTEQQVIWEYQAAPSSIDYIAMVIGDTRKVGNDWIVKDDAPDAAPGAEIRVRATGHRMCKLLMIAYGPRARILLENVSAGLELQVDAIDRGGAGIGDEDPVQQVKGITAATSVYGRATYGVMLHVLSELESRTTYVERFQTTLHEQRIGDIVTVWTPTDPPP